MPQQKEHINIKMEILGSKQGSINRMGDSKMVKRNGIPTNLENHMSKESLEKSMKQLSKVPTQEEIQAEVDRRLKREADIKVLYKEWLNTPHEREYIGHTPIADNHVIIKVFYYNEIPKSNFLIIEDESAGYHRVFPVAKVVSSSNPDLVPGDVVTIPSVMCKTVQSQEWLAYQKAVREQPSLKLEVPEPAVFVGRLSEWIQYMYQKDPFTDTNIDDQHTFCLRSSLLLSKIDK